MKKLVCLILLLSICAVCFVGCGSDTNTNPGQSNSTQSNPTQSKSAGDKPADKLVTVRAAVLPQQLSLPLYYISKQGWDVENGFKLELTTFQQGPAINEALGAGLWDVAAIGAAGVMSCNVYDAVHIMSHEDSSAGQEFMIRADSKFAKVKGYSPDYPEVYGSPETVKGATFMLPIGTGNQLLLDQYLNAMGLKEEDINMVNMNAPEGYQAFVSGKGDFSATAYPQTEDYHSAGYITAFNMNNMKCPYYDNLIASREFYEDPDKQEVLVKLLTQVLRCADEFKDENKLMDSMIEWYGVNGQKKTADSVRKQVLERPFFTVEDCKSSDNTASFKRMAEFFASIKTISDKDLEKVFKNIKPELLKKAIDQYGEMYGSK